MKVAWVRRMESRGVKNYPKRFQSAEGCYSHRATRLPHIRIKVAHKQFVGLSVPSDDIIYAVNGAVWQCPKTAQANVRELLRHSTQPCSADLPGVQVCAPSAHGPAHAEATARASSVAPFPACRHLSLSPHPRTRHHPAWPPLTPPPAATTCARA